MITKKPDFPNKFYQFNIFANDFHVIHNNHKRLVSYFRVPCQYPFLCLARQYPQPWPHLLYETFNSRPSATETTFVRTPSSCVSAGSGFFVLKSVQKVFLICSDSMVEVFGNLNVFCLSVGQAGPKGQKSVRRGFT